VTIINSCILVKWMPQGKLLTFHSNMVPLIDNLNSSNYFVDVHDVFLERYFSQRFTANHIWWCPFHTKKKNYCIIDLTHAKKEWLWTLVSQRTQKWTNDRQNSCKYREKCTLKKGNQFSVFGFTPKKTIEIHLSSERRQKLVNNIEWVPYEFPRNISTVFFFFY